jgi:prepilin-type N-terminal cleavage/methylation domain-containing protein
MKIYKSRGFTLIELVVVIVILGILAVTAAPRFLNYQRDAHLARSESAFANFANAVQLYHAKWLTEGEPTGPVDYGVGDIYPSNAGFPVSVDKVLNDPNQIEGEQCVALWHAIMQTDLTIQRLTTTILPSDTDIVSWYNSSQQCTYYYTTSFVDGEEMPLLLYSPLTGEFVETTGRNN